jgi:hypothetical protein
MEISGDQPALGALLELTPLEGGGVRLPARLLHLDSFRVRLSTMNVVP